MFGIHDFGLFLAAGILLNLTPGPDTVYILGRSVAQGREAGIASALGICVGSIFHTCASSLGLSANDCGQMKLSRNGSIALRARYLFFSVCVSRPPSDDVDLVRRCPATSFLRVKHSSNSNML